MINTRKIAVLCNYELLPDRVGGMDYFYWLFDKKCKENNINVDWFFPNMASHGEYSKLNIYSSDYDNVENYFLLHHTQDSYSHMITHFIEVCTPFYKKIKEVSNSKIIVVDHNPRPLNGYRLKKRIEKKVKGILYSKYIDLFVGVSQYSVNQIVLEFGNQIKNRAIVIHNGIDTNRFIKKTNFEFNKKFIVTSHLRQDKGIQDLIEAVHEIRKIEPINFTIDLYGKGDYGLILQKMIDEYSLSTIFNFKGSVSNLNELYHKYDYLIHPSHGETFCYSVVESLICNLPVITTKNQGNVLGFVKENTNGFLFEEGNIVQLKEILENILRNNKVLDFSKDMTIITKLSLQNMVDNYCNLIE